MNHCFLLLRIHKLSIQGFVFDLQFNRRYIDVPSKIAFAMSELPLYDAAPSLVTYLWGCFEIINMFSLLKPLSTHDNRRGSATRSTFLRSTSSKGAE